MKKKWNQVKKRICLSQGVLGTKEVTDYIGIGKLYRISLHLLEYKCLYIHVKDRGNIVVKGMNGRNITLDNPFLEQLIQIAKRNEIPVKYYDECKRTPANSMVISDKFIACFKGAGHIFYHSPQDSYKKVVHPVLSGQLGEYYSGIAEREFLCGRYRHSMNYIWSFLVLGPVFYQILLWVSNEEKKGRKIIFLGEEEHLLSILCQERNVSMGILPWNVSLDNGCKETIQNYSCALEREKETCILLGIRKKDADSLGKYWGCETNSIEKIIAGGKQNCEELLCNLERMQPILKSIEIEEFLYQYDEMELDFELKKVIAMGVESFLNQMDLYGVQEEFSSSDFEEILKFNSWYKKIMSERMK